MNYVRSNSLSLKYQRFPPLGCQDIRIGKFEFVAKTQFLYCHFRIDPDILFCADNTRSAYLPLLEGGGHFLEY